MLARCLQALRRYRNESGIHFQIYLLEHWTDLDKTWQKDEEWEKSDPVKFLRRSLQKPHKTGKILPTFFRDEYHAPVWSLPLYRFPQNLADIRESMCR